MFSQLKKELSKHNKNLAEIKDDEWENYCQQTWSEAKVLIGLPNTGSFDDMDGESPFKSFLKLASYISSLDESRDWNIITIPRMITHEARNALAKEAITGGYTHLMMIDSDHTFRHDLVHRLLLFQKDIIGVRAYKRTSPHYPCIFINHPDHSDQEAAVFADAVDMGVMLTDTLGMGAMLIKTEVFKKLSYPYFYFSRTGEDFNFCRDAREAGMKIFVDTDTEIGHVDQTIITRKDYLRELEDGTIRQHDENMLKLIEREKNNPNINFDKTKR
jgi:hypothetical protein